MTTIATIPSVTDATLGAELAPGSGLVAVEFTAAWCVPCRIMTPVLEAAARDYEGRLRIVQLDADANPAALTRLGVRGLPTMLLFRDGTIVDRIVGAVNVTTLRTRLDRAIAG